MPRKGFAFFLAGLLAVNAAALESAIPAMDLHQLSTEDLLLMDFPVNVASQVAQPLVKAPGIVTVVTREQIANSGARNLTDILNLVPGFVPAAELQNTVGYGVRGLWALEGKMLVLIDGLQINEMIYANPIFAGQAVTDYIDHIEIMRGPGSAIYGGFGELAVLNIITRGAANMKGGSVSASYGKMRDTLGRQNVNLNFGGRYADVGISLNATYGNGHTGDGVFRELTGEEFPMDVVGQEKAWLVNLGLDYQGLSVRFLDQSYATSSSIHNGTDDYDNYLVATDEPLWTLFNQYVLELKYAWRIGQSLVLKPLVLYNEIDGWNNSDDFAYEWGWNNHYPHRQVKAALSAIYNFSEKMNLTLGGEYIRDHTTAPDPESFRYNGDEYNREYVTQSVFAEYLAQTEYADFTLGARYDNHSSLGGAFVPRLAITKQLGDFHIKAIANRAYRAPTAMNIALGPTPSRPAPEIKPEFTTDYELEFGYTLFKNHTLTLNVFDTTIQDAIVYWRSPVSGRNVYANWEKCGTYGAELEYRWHEAWGNLTANYSFYRVSANNVEPYMPYVDIDTQVRENAYGLLQGFPAHKATLAASVNILSGLSVNPSVIYLSKRYFNYFDNSVIGGRYINGELDPELVANLYVRYVFLNDSIEVGLGVYNIFDAPNHYAPGYMDRDTATPAGSREFLLKLAYNF